MRALYDFEAENEDELTMKQGGILLMLLFVVLLRVNIGDISKDIVTVLSKEDDNWWEGELPTGARGKFPTNYVEVFKVIMKYLRNEYFV